jgi:hypothetical protein
VDAEAQSHKTDDLTADQDKFEAVENSMKLLDQELENLVGQVSPYSLPTVQLRDEECHQITNLEYEQLVELVKAFSPIEKPPDEKPRLNEEDEEQKSSAATAF